MRTWTLVVSVFVHAAIVAAILVAPIFATADLPDPRRPLTFEVLTPVVTPTMPSPGQPRSTPSSTSTASVPVTEPTAMPIDTPPVAPLPSIGVCDHPCELRDVFVGDGGAVGDLAAPPVIAPSRKEPVPIGGVIRPPKRIVYVAPVYPQIALAARVEAIVILQAVIDEQGSVGELKVLRGHPLLDAAAMDAVARWQFTPTLLNGTTVPVVMTVTVAFALTK